MLRTKANRIYDLINQDRAELRSVKIKFRALDEEEVLYYRPLTSNQKRDARYLATRKKQLKSIDSETVQEEEYIDMYLFSCSIIYLQSLDEDGLRVFENITDVEKIFKNMSDKHIETLVIAMMGD